MNSHNLLMTGIFTIPEAARLVGVSERRLRGWIGGYDHDGQPPLIQNELGWLDGRVAFSFLNLIEMRFVAFFENAKIPIQRIRAVMNEARTLLQHQHPFATELVFRVEGRKIVAEIAERNQVKRLYDLKSRNYEMRSVVLSSLRDDVIFDPSGVARAWYPRAKLAPNVIVHPRFSFGRPILRDSHIPTKTIASAVKAEGSTKAVAAWYEIPERHVVEAVKFETELRKAA